MVISLATACSTIATIIRAKHTKCYGSVSQAVSAKPGGRVAGNVHLAGGFSEERVRNKYRERERKRKIDRTKTI